MNIKDYKPDKERTAESLKKTMELFADLVEESDLPEDKKQEILDILGDESGRQSPDEKQDNSED